MAHNGPWLQTEPTEVMREGDEKGTGSEGLGAERPVVVSLRPRRR